VFGSKKKRRSQLRAQPFPPEWVPVLERNVPYYRFLPPEDREELQGHILVFLAEKNFEGCNGVEITDEIRVTIAAHASILILHRETDYFARLVTVLVYPSAFVAETRKKGPGKMVLHGEEVRVGESWRYGVVILAWDDVLESIANPFDGHNVMFHEFAHQLDAENTGANGFPFIEDGDLADEWSEVFQAEYDQLLDDLDEGYDTLIDEYGAESPAEFFAVVTETFFELPLDLQAEHPELYHALKQYFRQDPAVLMESATG
jgi:hypothetical protein